MKKRITKIWGIGLIVTMLVSLLVMAAPASAYDDNSWGTELTPSPLFYVVMAGSDVADYDVYGDGDEIWAVAGGTDNHCYKSVDGGFTWVLGYPSAFSDLTPDLIAIAPDNPAVVAVADKSLGLVKLTTSGGTIWDTLPVVGANLTDLDVSPTYYGMNFIAVSGYTTTAGIMKFYPAGSAAPSWKSAGTTASGFASADVVDAIAFSPNFPSDLVMVAVSSNSSGPVQYQIMSYSGAPVAWAWNSAPFPTGTTGYPVTMVTTAMAGNVTAADIALDPEYLGSDDILRNAFVGLSISTGTADDDYRGVYQMMDVQDKNIRDGYDVYSVAFDGTTLVAGLEDTTAVLRSSDPLSTIPTFYPSSTLKSPSGTGNVRLAWAGTNVLAGTTGDESAFCMSSNDGKSFNSISFIDTDQTNATDVAVAADGSVAYWATDNTVNLSIWSGIGMAWQRVLSIQGQTNCIVRVAPDDPESVYVATQGANTVYYTKDGGQEKWFERTCPITLGETIQDLAVESADVAYVLGNNGNVVKTTNSGFTWGIPVTTERSAGHSLTWVSEGVLLMGDTTGGVSYTTDGSDSWDKIIPAVEAASGNVVVVADADYANNNTVYAARAVSGANIMKFVIGTSSAWEDIYYAPPVATIDAVYGLTVVDGALYALTYSGGTGNQTYLHQCLTPGIASKTNPLAWASEPTLTTTHPYDSSAILGVDSASPNGLKASGGENPKLWACKTGGAGGTPAGLNGLCGYNDVLGGTTPTLQSPADGFSDPINTVTGKANEVTFTWARPSNAEEYVLWLAYDPAFTEGVTMIMFESTLPVLAKSVGPEKETDSAATGHISGEQKIAFMPGTTYYWMVRANDPLASPWSEARSFTIQPGVATVPTIGSPANGATDISVNPAFSWSPVSRATMYEFQLAVSTNFAAPLYSETMAETGIRPPVKLDPGTTYFWRVRAVEPVVGDWSTIANFMVAVEEAPPPPPVEVVTTPPPVIEIPPAPPPQEIVIPPAPAPTPAISEGLLLAIIIIGAVLVIAVIVLIVRTRRTV